MILYHGGTEVIKCPVCRFGRANLDFGPGFYLTDILEQAKSWSLRQARDRGLQPLVNIYEFDHESAVRYFRYRHFEAYDESWLDFILDNRSGESPWTDYDIVEGGIANDRVIDTVELYSIGILSKEDALGRLAYHQPNNQICILNQEVADKYLKFLNVI